VSRHADNQRYQAIVEASPDAVIQADRRGLIVGWNTRAASIFGWSAAYAVGRPLHDLIIPERDRQAHLEGLQRYLSTGEARVLNTTLELDALHRDGHEFPVELTVTAARTGDDVEFTAFLRDISGRRKAEAQRLAMEARLHESRRLELIGTFASGIAHDFNNIVAAILGHAALVGDAVGTQHAAHGNLQHITRAAERARLLVRQLLAYARKEPPRLERHALAPLVEEAATMLRAVAPPGAVIDVQIGDPSVCALCDATQVHQVLMNLGSNALQALKGAGGRVGIGLAVAQHQPGGAWPAGLRTEVAYARLWVADTGCGIDPAVRHRIFEPFFTTKGLGSGTGLGLAVVQAMVLAHQGAITVHSEPGRGSRFDLYLPIADEAGIPAAPVHERPASSGTAGRGEHVLYIDDDEVILAMAEALLRRAGYRVTCCTAAADALDRVRADPASFDAVVTDYTMPGLSGIDVVRALATLRADLPVIVSSGLANAELELAAAKAGAKAVMQKEDSLEQLLPLLRHVLDAAQRQR
jgi:PAS domain S-box-containing protein